MIGVFVLAAFIKLVLFTKRPFLCAGIYAAISFVLGLCLEIPFFMLLLQVIIGFGLVGLYFWLLGRYSESGFVFWMILIGGLVFFTILRLG